MQQHKMKKLIHAAQNGLQKVATFVKKNAAAVLAVVGLTVGAGSAVAQSAGPTELPVDPSFLYTSLDSAVIPAITVVLGFTALFIVIRWIRKAMSKG